MRNYVAKEDQANFNFAPDGYIMLHKSINQTHRSTLMQTVESVTLLYAQDDFKDANELKTHLVKAPRVKN